MDSVDCRGATESTLAILVDLHDMQDLQGCEGYYVLRLQSVHHQNKVEKLQTRTLHQCHFRK